MKKHFKIDAFLCCDYSLTCEWLGISTSADYFCYLCKVNRKSAAMTKFEETSPARLPIDKWKIGKFGVKV